MKMIRRFALLIVMFTAAAAFASDQEIRLEVTVPASREDVWKAWTTVEGVKSFFAGGANIDLRPDGAYEIFFAPEAPEGQRGADGMRLLLVQPNVALAFTWNAPGKFANARPQRTHVMIKLHSISEKVTKVTLVHDGFGEGEEWHEVRTYFEDAWGNIVLPRLVQSFASK
jgi:uncharacterized protein YndB with AHSA1/START domain